MIIRKTVIERIVFPFEPRIVIRKMNGRHEWLFRCLGAGYRFRLRIIIFGGLCCTIFDRINYVILARRETDIHDGLCIVFT
jgi:hypothetical protein